MEKVKEIRVLLEDGSFSEAYPMGADSSNIDLNSGKNLEEALTEDYVKNTDYATNLKSGVIKIGNGITQSNGITSAETKTYTQYQSESDNLFIGKGTLENTIAGKNLEKANNRVVTINENSTDIQYPTTKSVYDHTLGSEAITANEGETISVNTLEDSRLNINLKGNTSQDTTIGKNLFTTDYLTSNTFITYTKLSDNSFSFTATGTWKKATYNVPCKPNTNYYFNFSSTSSMFIQIRGVQTETQIVAVYQSYLTSFNSGENTELQINIDIGQNSIASGTISDIQLEEGTTATSFEKYTGGIPSPNPSYPQNVNVVTGDNTIVVEGKNLFNVSKLQNATWNSSSSSTRVVLFLDKINQGTKISITNLDTTTYRYSVGFTTLNYPSSSNININESGWKTTQTHTITASNNGYPFLQISRIDNTNIAPSDVEGKFQMEIGELTDYTPYVSQNYPINLGTLELCKIGNYQDYIYKNNGKWYVHKAIGKIVLDGTNTAFSSKSGQVGNSYVSQTNFISNPSTSTIPYVFSNKFKPICWDDRANYNDNAVIFGYLTANTLNFRFGTSSSITTLELANSWLETNNVNLYGVLATPTDTQITDTTLINELDNLYNAKSYSITNISQTNDNLPFVLTLTSFNNTLNGEFLSNEDSVNMLIEKIEKAIDIINGEVI